MMPCQSNTRVVLFRRHRSPLVSALSDKACNTEDVIMSIKVSKEERADTRVAVKLPLVLQSSCIVSNSELRSLFNVAINENNSWISQEDCLVYV